MLNNPEKLLKLTVGKGAVVTGRTKHSTKSQANKHQENGGKYGKLKKQDVPEPKPEGFNGGKAWEKGLKMRLKRRSQQIGCPSHRNSNKLGVGGLVSFSLAPKITMGEGVKSTRDSSGQLSQEENRKKTIRQKCGVTIG